MKKRSGEEVRDTGVRNRIRHARCDITLGEPSVRSSSFNVSCNVRFFQTANFDSLFMFSPVLDFCCVVVLFVLTYGFEEDTGIEVEGGREVEREEGAVYVCVSVRGVESESV